MKFNYNLSVISYALALFISIGAVGLADKPSNPGGGNGGGEEEPPATYTVVLSNARDMGRMGLQTTCPGNTNNSLIMTHGKSGKNNSLFMRNDPAVHSERYLDIFSDIQWNRSYPSPSSGNFDGCFGSTPDRLGILTISFGSHRGNCNANFLWHFEYYLDLAPASEGGDIREHFTMVSDDVDAPCFDPAGFSGTVSGRFDLQYYLTDANNNIQYESFTNDVGRIFTFDITVTPN